jgi:hypothetical protein
MATSGIGSHSSPIIIDDSDDDDDILVMSPPTTKARPYPSTTPVETPQQEPIDVDSIEAPNPTFVRQGSPDQLKDGVGYAILRRMGYQPGHGLGVNLEGIRHPTSVLLGG